MVNNMVVATLDVFTDPFGHSFRNDGHCAVRGSDEDFSVLYFDVLLSC